MSMRDMKTYTDIELVKTDSSEVHRRRRSPEDCIGFQTVEIPAEYYFTLRHVERDLLDIKRLLK